MRDVRVHLYIAALPALHGFVSATISSTGADSSPLLVANVSLLLLLVYLVARPQPLLSQSQVSKSGSVGLWLRPVI